MVVGAESLPTSRAYRRSSGTISCSRSSAPKPIDQVLDALVCRLIAATIADESTPPLRKLPSGTSLTICRRTAASTAARTSSRHSSRPLLGLEAQVPALGHLEARLRSTQA